MGNQGDRNDDEVTKFEKVVSELLPEVRIEPCLDQVRLGGLESSLESRVWTKCDQ